MTDVWQRLRALGDMFTPNEINATRDLFAPRALQPQAVGAHVTRNLAYGPDPRHRLDVFAPAAARNLPVVLFVHGGGYVGGDKGNEGDAFFNNVGAWAVRHGFIGVTMTYRLAPAHVWPAGAQDVDLALAWLRSQALDLGGDPDRIVLMGHSGRCGPCGRLPRAAWLYARQRCARGGGHPGLGHLRPRRVSGRICLPDLLRRRPQSRRAAFDDAGAGGHFHSRPVHDQRIRSGALPSAPGCRDRGAGESQWPVPATAVAARSQSPVRGHAESAATSTLPEKSWRSSSASSRSQLRVSSARFSVAAAVLATVDPAVDAVTALVQAVLDPVALLVETFLPTLAAVVQTVVDPVALGVESFGAHFVAVGRGLVGRRIQLLVDAVAALIEALLGVLRLPRVSRRWSMRSPRASSRASARSPRSWAIAGSASRVITAAAIRVLFVFMLVSLGGCWGCWGIQRGSTDWVDTVSASARCGPRLPFCQMTTRSGHHRHICPRCHMHESPRVPKRPLAILLLCSVALCAQAAQTGDPGDYQRAAAAVAKRAAQGPKPGRARNVILFVGDGMGIATITAARILEGQRRGDSGEQNHLSFEDFPYSALVRTYSADQQVSDSAPTATAMMTGSHANDGALSVSPLTRRRTRPMPPSWRASRCPPCSNRQRLAALPPAWSAPHASPTATPAPPPMRTRRTATWKGRAGCPPAPR